MTTRWGWQLVRGRHTLAEETGAYDTRAEALAALRTVLEARGHARGVACYVTGTLDASGSLGLEPVHAREVLAGRELTLARALA